MIPCHESGNESPCALQGWRILGIGILLRMSLEDVVSEIFSREYSMGISDALLLSPAEDSQMDPPVCIFFGSRMGLVRASVFSGGVSRRGYLMNEPIIANVDGDIREAC
jgi:hypothetical protein